MTAKTNSLTKRVTKSSSSSATMMSRIRNSKSITFSGMWWNISYPSASRWYVTIAFESSNECFEKPISSYAVVTACTGTHIRSRGDN